MAPRVDYEQHGRTYTRFRQPDPRIAQRIVDRLRDDLASGAWDAGHGHLRDLPSYDGALRLVVAEPALQLSMAIGGGARRRAPHTTYGWWS